MSKVVLDSESFKALASDTRLEIMKALDVRRLTVSELGRHLELNKATVYEHLKQLVAAGLVKKKDEGRKWIYYELTWKGSNVLHPENAQIFLMLGTATLGLGGSVAALGSAMDWWLGGGSLPQTEGTADEPNLDDTQHAPPPEGDAAADTQPAAGQAPQDGAGAPGGGDAPAQQAEAGGSDIWADPWLWGFIALLVAAVIVTVFALRLYLPRLAERRALRQELAKLSPEPDAAA